MSEYYVYILANKSRMLYVGVTNDLERRVHEHKMKLVPGFTSRYRLNRLVYFESTGDVLAAIEREKEIKGWVRRKKTVLIHSLNPEWRDLSEDWADIPVILSETKNLGEGVRKADVPVILSEAKNLGEGGGKALHHPDILRCAQDDKRESG